MQLRHRQGGKALWIGSCHLPRNEGSPEFKRYLQGKGLGLREGVEYGAQEGRQRLLLQYTQEKGMERFKPAQEQIDAPTFIPRRAGVPSTQIDVAYSRGMSVGPLVIEEASHVQVGADHERISVAVTLQWTKRKAKHRRGGVLKMASMPPPQTSIDQGSLENLARTHCRPRQAAHKFRPSQECRVLNRVATTSRTAYDWKRYLAQLRKEEDAWKAARLDRAASCWDEFRAVTKNSKTWEADYFRECRDEDPAKSIHEHFQAIFKAPAEEGDVDGQLTDICARLSGGLTPITEEEITRAVMACKPNKAVGPDGVPNELLKGLAEDPILLQALTLWFNRIFSAREIPTEWSEAIMKLLAKKSVPVAPSDLWPIALSCHTCKVYATVITNRLHNELRPKASRPRQLAGKGRRACDLLWSAKTLMALLREWGRPAVLVKLDVTRAFDSLSRVQLALRIASWCGHKPNEAANLVLLLRSSKMFIHLPWSSSIVKADRGVRQGAPESPTLFAKVIESVLEEIDRSEGLVFDGLLADFAGFMDDLFLFKSSVPHMRSMLNELIPRLAALGLQVQPPKCQLFLIGNVRSTRLLINDFKLLPLRDDEPLILMNALVHPIIGDIDVLYFQINKARKKLYSLKHILQGKGAVRSKLKLLEVVVLGSLRWMLGAVFPSARAQHALNAFQMYSVA